MASMDVDFPSPVVVEGRSLSKRCRCCGKVALLSVLSVSLCALSFALGLYFAPKIRPSDWARCPVAAPRVEPDMQGILDALSRAQPAKGVKRKLFWEAIRRAINGVGRLFEEAAPTEYYRTTGLNAHELPEFYEEVHEKTIWLYWYNPDSCPDSTQCTLPPFIQLCVDSIRHNAGSFDVRLVHQDQVFKYLNPIELPFQFNSPYFKPAQRKDSLMNALLARYGGVAFDISNVLLRPMDALWNEMLAEGAGFRGYMYRLNGDSWGNSETMAVWFLMARREGIFRSVATSAVINMGDDMYPNHMRNPYFGLGDGTLAPIISMYNFSLPTCRGDPKVHNKHQCPEYNAPMWPEMKVMTPLNHTKLMLSDPRDGPQFMFAWLDDMNWATWDVTDEQCREDWKWTGCCSPKQCWGKVTERFDRGALPFVKFFGSGGPRVKKLSKEDIVKDEHCIARQLFQLAGLNVTDDGVVHMLDNDTVMIV